MIKKNINEKKKKDWCGQVAKLMDEIKKWAECEKWMVDVHEKTISEDEIGTYSAKELFVQTAQGRLVIDPVGRDIVGADGRIDICSFPTFHRMFLIRKGGKWVLKTDSGVNWPNPWNKKTFVEIAKELTFD